MTSARQLLLNKLAKEGIAPSGRQLDHAIRQINNFDLPISLRCNRLLSNKDEFMALVRWINEQDSKKNHQD